MVFAFDNNKITKYVFYRPFLFLLCYYWITMQSSVPSPVPSLEQEAANGARKEATTIQQKRQQEEYDGGGCGYRNDCCASCLSVMMRGWWWFVLRLLYCCQRHAWMFARLLFTHRHTPSGRGTSTRGMCQSERVWWNPLLDYHHHSETTIMSVVGGLQRNCGDVHFICASHSVITVIVSHPPQELWVASCIPPSLYVHGNKGIRDHDEARLTWWCCIPLVSIYHIIMQIVGKSQTSLPVPSLPSSAGARHTGVRIQQCKVFAGFAQVPTCLPTF